MQKNYKILLSAYACEPNRGSEPGVGWHWAQEVTYRGHEVWVVTRSNNQSPIEDYFATHNKPINLHFIYYDLPKFIRTLKKGVLGVNVYYFIWQIGLQSFVKKKHALIGFDFIHHITFGVFRHPSFLYRINIPIIFGPVGGGEQTPKALKKSHPLKYKIIESFRESINCISRFNPLLLRFYNKATLIYTKTDETKAFIPNKNRIKISSCLEIGIESIDNYRAINMAESSKFQILFVGRIVYWKGIDLAVISFNTFLNQVKCDSELIFIGNGDYLNNLQGAIQKFKIEANVKIIDWMPQSKLKDYYQNSSLFLFPSLHDSSGNVALEALSHGLPVICLDLGGPCQIVNETCGRVISTKGKSEEEVVHSLTKAILELKQNRELRNKLSEGAVKRAAEFTWEKTVGRVYEKIEEYMEKQAR